MSLILSFIAGSGLALGVLAVQSFIATRRREYYGTLPPMTTKLNREMLDTVGNTSYAVSGNYQSTLSPRFINTNVGANIRYHMNNASAATMAADTSNPTTYRQTTQHREIRPSLIDPPQASSAKAAAAAAAAAASAAGCSSTGGVSTNTARASRILNERYLNGNVDSAGQSESVARMRRIQKEYTNVADMLPVNNGEVVRDTLNMQGRDTVNKLRVDEQPIIYDRFMYANSKSNLRGGADPFRGDLPIVPVLPQAASDSGVWFRPSVTPHIDLGRGYLGVAGGFDNETNTKLRELMVASSGGTLQTFGGNNMPLQRSIINTSAGDLMVSAFV